METNCLETKSRGTYISTFKAVIVFGSKKQISGLKNQFLGL